jgi:hypothetical protein
MNKKYCLLFRYALEKRVKRYLYASRRRWIYIEYMLQRNIVKCNCHRLKYLVLYYQMVVVPRTISYWTHNWSLSFFCYLNGTHLQSLDFTIIIVKVDPVNATSNKCSSLNSDLFRINITLSKIQFIIQCSVHHKKTKEIVFLETFMFIITLVKGVLDLQIDKRKKHKFVLNE